MNYQRINDEESQESILDRKASILLPILQSTEKKFFELVASGNVEVVKEFLEENEDFNINCVNFQGVSALHIAIANRSEEMVELLLSVAELDVGDCALHAVRENLPRILHLILERLRETAPGLEFAGCTQSSDFPDHVTPLVLAAQCGHYEIIEQLIERGHSISRPHRPDCGCSDCKRQLEQDDLLHAQTRRLHLYRAACSPAYICHSSDDPILTAFELAHELSRCAQLAPEFRAAYEELSGQAASFAVELVGRCRSTEEVELVLRQTRGTHGGQFRFPRLVLAMDLKQKAFVAHPNTQQVLEAAWHGDWHEWRALSPARTCLLVAARAAVLPLVAAMCVLAPGHAWVARWRLPVSRMLSHTASYLLFLVLAFLQSNAERNGARRGPPCTGLEPLLVAYVVGFAWGAARLAVLQGPARYYRMLWSWYELAMLLLFCSTFLFWAASGVDVRLHGDADLERKYWHWLDPALVAEGLLCVATIMAFFRLLFLCQLNYQLGPLQISLGKMSVDIAKFALIFAIITVSWSAGLCKLYQYYQGMVQQDDASGIKTVQQDSFVDLPSTLKTLFWALFCMSPIESADVVIENLPGDIPGSTVINRHRFTEAVGYVAFACFQVLSVVVILNMLIATMSNTFQRVTDNVDIEWTFGRMEVYVQYMLQTTLPPPFNLLPTAGGLAAAAEWLTACAKGSPGKRARWSPGHCCYVEREPDRQLLREYPVLMSQLAQRYFRDKVSSTDSASADMDALRQDVAQLRAQVAQLTGTITSNT